MVRQRTPRDESATGVGANAYESERPKGTLRETVKQALLDVLQDKAAPAAAKASAGRTLLEYFDDSESAHSNDGRCSAELSLEELDAEIHKLSR